MKTVEEFKEALDIVNDLIQFIFDNEEAFLNEFTKYAPDGYTLEFVHVAKSGIRCTIQSRYTTDEYITRVNPVNVYAWMASYSSITSVLEAIKKYPLEFAESFARRASTTPSAINKYLHLHCKLCVEMGGWDALKGILENPEYNNPLGGVVACVNLDRDKGHILDLYDQGKIA